MIKTIIFELNDVIISDELLKFKNYEILWQYLRRDRQWKDFEGLLKVREKLIQKYADTSPYRTIAGNYLSEYENHRFIYETEYFTKKYFARYIRIIPGMRYILRLFQHYYQLVLYSSRENYIALLDRNFHISNYFRDTIIAKNDSSGWSNLKSFMEKKQLLPDETVFVSPHESNLIPATRLGLSAIFTAFDTKTSGFRSEQHYEKSFLASEDRLINQMANRIMLSKTSIVVVRTPDELTKIMQRFEEKEPLSQQQEEQEIDAWKILREAMFPELREKK